MNLLVWSGNTSTSSVHRREQGTLRQAQCIAGNREYRKKERINTY
ncbi:MAG: hypothetical protein ACK6A9_09430 [Dolichospermum sp.]